MGCWSSASTQAGLPQRASGHFVRMTASLELPVGRVSSTCSLQGEAAGRGLSHFLCFEENDERTMTWPEPKRQGCLRDSGWALHYWKADTRGSTTQLAGSGRGLQIRQTLRALYF